MSGPDGSKRQRTDDRQSKSMSPRSNVSSKAYSSSAPDLQQPAKQEAIMPTAAATDTRIDLSFGDLLERLLTSQERLANDVARLQTTVDTVLDTLRQSQFTYSHESQRRSVGGDYQLTAPHAKPLPTNSPPLPSILLSQSQDTDTFSPAAVSASVHSTALRGRSPAPSSLSMAAPMSPNPHTRHSSTIGPADDSESSVGAGVYRLTVSRSQGYSHDTHQTSMRNPASTYYSTPPPAAAAAAAATATTVGHHQTMSSSITLPPPAELARTLQSAPGHSHMAVPKIRSPPLTSSSSYGRQHQHHVHAFSQHHPGGVHPMPATTPVSAGSNTSALFSPTRYHPSHSQLHPQLQQQQQPQHHQQQQQKKSVSRFSLQGNMQYNMRPASASPHRMHHHQQQHIEQPVSLPPIIRTPPPPSTIVGHVHGNSENNRSSNTAGGQPSSSARGFAIQQRTTTPRPVADLTMETGISPYSPASSHMSGMLVDATPTTAKPSFSPRSATLPGFARISRVPPPLNTTTSTPTSAGGMAESPRGSSTGASGLLAHRHHNPQQQHAAQEGASGGRSYSTDASSSQGTVLAHNKVEKNRFQANIRSFVDHYFTVPSNPHWDYQQSFKAPRNAQTTQQIIEVFHAANGGTYERIEHGLGVYFSSLKAKHRTTEDKAMLKQQRDRRRARKIKKAAGRRKVFDQSRYPFLPPDFDMQLCFVPAAMSPEHTDDDGEVKVGILPWRQDTFTRLFRHLDTLRPKRTPRPGNAKLSDRLAPPPEIPSFMIDPAYVSVEGAEQEDSHGPEEDIEMESMSENDETHE